MPSNLPASCVVSTSKQSTDVPDVGIINKNGGSPPALFKNMKEPLPATNECLIALLKYVSCQALA